MSDPRTPERPFDPNWLLEPGWAPSRRSVLRGAAALGAPIVLGAGAGAQESAPEELEEERRLAYVGLTRAEQRLYLTNAWSRSLYGATQYNPPSRFLDEIPEELLVEAEGSRSTKNKRSRSRDGASSSRGTGSLDNTPKWASNREERIARALAAREERRAGRGDGDEVDAPPAEPEFRIGQDVRHPQFGEGVILDIEGAGEKAEATVNFADVGQKVLLLSWAPLERI